MVKFLKHIELAVKEYDKKGLSISPISEEDGLIIMLLIEVFKKIEYFDLLYILEKYKAIPDKNIIILLSDFIQNGTSPNKEFIQIRDKSINISYIQSITEIDSYDVDKRRIVYKLIINEDNTEKLLFSNVEIEFDSEGQRTKELKNLKEKLKYYKIKFI
jgi:hypothetical protein